MAPDRRLVVSLTETLQIRSACGISPWLDPEAKATTALARMGMGFVEIGPLRFTNPSQEHDGSLWLTDQQTIVLPAGSFGLTLAEVEVTARFVPDDVALCLRLPEPHEVHDGESQPAIEAVRTASRSVSVITIPANWFDTSDARFAEFGQRLISACRENDGLEKDVSTVLAVLNGLESDAATDSILNALRNRRIDGLLIDSTLTQAGDRQLCPAAFERAKRTLINWRSKSASSVPIIVNGGIHEPRQALELVDAGATAIQLDSGLAFSGPALAKRINESLLDRVIQAEKSPSRSCATSRLAETVSSCERPSSATQAWYWTLLLGISLFGGGVLATGLALTRVVLPYDEAMTGLTREQLSGINSRLLPFMVHDRITLAGTMLAVGWLYLALSWYAVRRGIEWARKIVVWSALAGFFSFFTFLGFGYFDAFHAFVSGILLQFTLLAMHSPIVPRQVAFPDWHNDRAWQRSQWGQLLFVIHGATLIVAGLVICVIGSTTVFIADDLSFLNSTVDELCAASPRLIPLVAHDRATWGGMLLTCGIVTVLSSLWGFQRGQAWLLRSLLVAGSIAYGGTILVHWHVGYTSLNHLLPAYGGMISLYLGGVLSWQFLHDGEAE